MQTYPGDYIVDLAREALDGGNEVFLLVQGNEKYIAIQSIAHDGPLAICKRGENQWVFRLDALIGFKYNPKTDLSDFLT